MAIQKKKAARPRTLAESTDQIPVENKEVVSTVVPQDEPKNAWRKFLFFLQLRDGFWSIPVAFIVFIMVGKAVNYFLGYGTGTYDPSFIQPLFMAGAVMIGLINFTSISLWLSFRVLHRYKYGSHKPEEGIVKNLSKEDWNNLAPWQRIIFLLGLSCFLMGLGVAVFIKMI